MMPECMRLVPLLMLENYHHSCIYYGEKTFATLLDIFYAIYQKVLCLGKSFEALRLRVATRTSNVLIDLIITVQLLLHLRLKSCLLIQLENAESK